MQKSNLPYNSARDDEAVQNICNQLVAEVKIKSFVYFLDFLQSFYLFIQFKLYSGLLYAFYFYSLLQTLTH